MSVKVAGLGGRLVGRYVDVFVDGLVSISRASVFVDGWAGR